MCGCNNEPLYPTTVTADSTTCEITIANLLDWKSVLLYAKSEDRIADTGWDSTTFNIRLGSVLSALNYTGDYCEIYDRLLQVKEAMPVIKTALGL
jgi:hypothetical protein